jgi:hypothetical protein
MSEDKWQVLQGLARTRGFDLAVDGGRFSLSPRVRIGRNRSPVFSSPINDVGIEAASAWLLSKRKQFDSWRFNLSVNECKQK